jgi:hypothetical protein
VSLSVDLPAYAYTAKLPKATVDEMMTDLNG